VMRIGIVIAFGRRAAAHAGRALDFSEPASNTERLPGDALLTAPRRGL
jgi:hypothetical protein